MATVDPFDTANPETQSATRVIRTTVDEMPAPAIVTERWMVTSSPCRRNVPLGMLIVIEPVPCLKQPPTLLPLFRVAIALSTLQLLDTLMTASDARRLPS